MFELINNRLVPLLVDFSPHYVGMSTMLSTRLKHHVSGYMDNTPADHVLQEFMQTNATTAEQAAYATADRKTQVELRRLAMERRNLWVKTTHAPNAKTAGRLERAMASSRPHTSRIRSTSASSLTPRWFASCDTTPRLKVSCGIAS